MKKLDLQGWAAVAEIVGTVGIVISLLFVAHSVNRNTVELQSANENAHLQLNDAIIAGLLSNTDDVLAPCSLMQLLFLATSPDLRLAQ